MTDQDDVQSQENDPEGHSVGAETSPARRKLLKALAGAGGVVAAGALLPEKWTQPVVDRILVPAHAQATANVEECGNTIIISGRTVECSDAPFEEGTLYTFSFDGTCLSVVSRSVSILSSPSAANELLVAAYRRAIDTDQSVDIRVFIWSTLSGVYSSSQTCDGDPVGSFDETGSRSLLIDGVSFSATFAISRTDNVVSHGDITVAPG